MIVVFLLNKEIFGFFYYLNKEPFVFIKINCKLLTYQIKLHNLLILLVLKNIKYCIITGASQGLGAAFTNYLLKLDYCPIIISRNIDNLSILESSLNSNKTREIIKLAIDLSQISAIDGLFKYMEDNQIYPELLINNVGIANYGSFIESEDSEFRNIIDLNIESFTILTHKYLNYIYGRKASILNVASTYAFRSAENYAVYAASKSYIFSFSRSLRKELIDSKIGISVFCPGRINTDFDKRSGKISNKMESRKGLSPDFAAKFATDAMLNGEFLIIPGLLRKMLRIVYQLFPTIF